MPASRYSSVPQGGGIGLAGLLMAALLTGCPYYSLTGATIPGHLQTVAIPLAEDRSVGAPAGVDQRLTDMLVDRFAGRTRLDLVSDESSADAVVLVEIERYANEPTAVTGQEVAALNRVTVSVRVRYLDRVEDSERLSRVFSQSDTYDASRLDLEAPTAERILAQIADDIFTAATSDW